MLKSTAAVLVLLLIAGVCWAEPRPQSISGSFEPNSELIINGWDFGDIPASGLSAGTVDNQEELAFCVLVSDSRQLSEDSFQRKMPLLEWSSFRIKFSFNSEGLGEIEEFYFYVIDKDGLKSSPVGPWKVNSGVLPSKSYAVPFVFREGQLEPYSSTDGEPIIESIFNIGRDDLMVPGQPRITEWGGERVEGDAQIPPSPDSIHGFGFGSNITGYDESGWVDHDKLGPGLYVGDQPSLGDCSLLWKFPTSSWSGQLVEFKWAQPEGFSEGQMAYFFIVNQSGARSNGFPFEIGLIPYQE